MTARVTGELKYAHKLSFIGYLNTNEWMSDWTTMMCTLLPYHMTRRMWKTKSSSWCLNNTYHKLQKVHVCFWVTSSLFIIYLFIYLFIYWYVHFVLSPIHLFSTSHLCFTTVILLPHPSYYYPFHSSFPFIWVVLPNLLSLVCQLTKTHEVETIYCFAEWLKFR